MRRLTPLASVTLVYGAGLLAGPVFLVPERILLVIVFCVLIWAAVSFRWGVLLFAAAVLGVAAGGIASQARKSECRQVLRPGRVQMIVRLLERPTADGLATGRVLHSPAGCHGTILLSIGRSDISAGATVVVVGKVLRNRMLSTLRARVLDLPVGGTYAVRDRLQRRIRSLYGRRAGLIEALILARRAGVEPGLKRRFRDAGMSHLLAISGLHVGIVAAWLFFLFRILGLRRLAPGGSVIAVWIYVAFIGLPAAATRAGIFITIYFVARLRQRHPGPADVISAAALSLFLSNPGFALKAGAWLSIAAVWGTVEALRRFREVPAWQRLLLSSAGATLATQPITAFAFGTVSPVGVLSNLAAIPLTAVAIPAVIVSLLVGEIPAAGSAVILGLIERVSVVVSGIPGGTIHGQPGAGFALPWLAILTVTLWFVRKRPRGTLVVAYGLLALAVGVWLSTAVALRRQAGGRLLRLYFLDVGQGDAIVIRTPRGRWITVDGGARIRGVDMGRKVVVPFLRSHGASGVDLAIASHGDADHLGGVPAIITEFSPGTVIEPGQALGTELYQEFQDAMAAAGGRWVAGRAGDSVALDSVVLRVLHPSARWVARTSDPNENSLVIRLSYGTFDALLIGDAGMRAESALVASLAPVEVLKVGHHGSRTSTSEMLLRGARPRVAVVSVGRNRYGHPSPRVLQRLARRGADVYRTDRGGTVSIETDGNYFVVRQGVEHSPWERLKCQIIRLLPLSASFSSRSACFRKPPVSSRAYSTT